MDRVFISWTIENWITVVLMASLGYLAFVLLDQFVFQKFSGRGSNESSGGSAFFDMMAA